MKSANAPRARTARFRAGAWLLLPIVVGHVLPYIALAGVFRGDHLAASEYFLDVPLVALRFSLPSVALSVLLACTLLASTTRPLLPWLSVGGTFGFVVYQVMVWGPLVTHRINSTAFVEMTPLSFFGVAPMFLTVAGIAAGWVAHSINTEARGAGRSHSSRGHRGA